jgi:hypothetical protein
VREKRPLYTGSHRAASSCKGNAIETGRYLPSLPLAMAIERYFGRAIEKGFRDDDEAVGAQ